MKSMEQSSDTMVPFVTVDPSLGKYKAQTPFPKKLAKAEKMLGGVKIPRVKQPSNT